MTTTTTHGLQRKRLEAMVLNGSGHVFDARTGRSYCVNQTGQVALLLLQDGAQREAIINRLSALCEQSESVVAAGVDAFLEQLAEVAS